MRIGIYGGTFDPPHLGHMEAAKTAISYLHLDRLLLIPNKLPPHKFLPEDGAGAEDRREMVTILADGIGPKAKCLDIELTREGKSYTVDTIHALREQEPDAEFFLMMGTDMFLSFETWHEPETIAKEVTLVPFAREEGASRELFAVQSETLREHLGAKVTVLPIENVYPVSSSQARKLLQSEETQDRGGGLLWPAVYGYILRKGLYGADNNMKGLTPSRLRAVSYSMMYAKRIPHVKGTEETAVALALIWGENPDYARRAAILHDCTKYYSLAQQLEICACYGIELDEMERESVKMQHAKTGAALAQHVFGEAPEICAAIDCHTTGKGNMTTFDKILYLADYIEPNRNFEGVDELRQLAFSDLDKAMQLGLRTTLEELREKNAPVHKNTQAALAQWKG